MQLAHQLTVLCPQTVTLTLPKFWGNNFDRADTEFAVSWNNNTFKLAQPLPHPSAPHAHDEMPHPPSLLASRFAPLKVCWTADLHRIPELGACEARLGLGVYEYVPTSAARPRSPREPAPVSAIGAPVQPPPSPLPPVLTGHASSLLPY
jgi:hypothetical protein